MSVDVVLDLLLFGVGGGPTLWRLHALVWRGLHLVIHGRSLRGLSWLSLPSGAEEGGHVVPGGGAEAGALLDDVLLIDDQGLRVVLMVVDDILDVGMQVLGCGLWVPVLLMERLDLLLGAASSGRHVGGLADHVGSSGVGAGLSRWVEAQALDVLLQNLLEEGVVLLLLSLGGLGVRRWLLELVALHPPLVGPRMNLGHHQRLDGVHRRLLLWGILRASDLGRLDLVQENAWAFVILLIYSYKKI